jgi:hypothetical protein
VRVFKLLCDEFNVDIQIPHFVAQVLVAGCRIDIPRLLGRLYVCDCPRDWLPLCAHYFIDLFLLLSETVLLLHEHTPQLANDPA